MSPFEELISYLAEEISPPRVRKQKILLQSSIVEQKNSAGGEFGNYEKEN